MFYCISDQINAALVSRRDPKLVNGLFSYLSHAEL